MTSFEEAVNAVYEGVRRDVLTKDFSAKLFADIKMIFDNLERVKTARDLHVLAKGINTFRAYLSGLMATGRTSQTEFDFPGSIHGALYNKAREWVRAGRLDTDTGFEWVRRKQNLLERPTSRLLQLFTTLYDLWTSKKKRAPNRFELDSYRAAAESYARDLKDELDTVIDEVDSLDGSSLTLKTPVKEETTIEGLPVTIQAYDAEDPEHRDMLKLARDGISGYIRAAKQRLPKLLALSKRVNILFDAPPGLLGVYYTLSSTINIAIGNIWGNQKTAAQFIQTIAHETGHHLFQKVLTQAGRDLWEAAINSDVEELDLRKIVTAWPKSIDNAMDAAKEIASRDPKTAVILMLLVTFGAQTTTNKTLRLPPDRWDFIEAARQIQDDPELATVRVPKHPVTAYGSTNAQETFSEVTGTLVAYGHKAVHPLVRKLYQVVTQWELP